eukprot:3394274-Amphidinium_carterae.1
MLHQQVRDCDDSVSAVGWAVPSCSTLLYLMLEFHCQGACFRWHKWNTCEHARHQQVGKKCHQWSIFHNMTDVAAH